MEFGKTTCWYDQLPTLEQNRIKRQARELSLASDRLLPVAQGESLTDQLDAARHRFLSCRDPFCLIRVSDCELGLLGGGFLASNRLGDLAWHFKMAGYDRGAFFMRGEFIQAIQESALVGLQQNWLPCREDTATILTLLDFELPLANGVEVHLPYRLLVDGTLFSFLAGKRTLLIGALAEQLAHSWSKTAFLNSYQCFGPIDATRIVGTIRTRTRSEGGAWLDFRQLTKEIEASDFDVALLSCGAAAKPLAWRAWKAGKTALDVGFVFDALLDVEPIERAKRPVLREANWPARSGW